jgi:hypothetical protein
MGFGNEEEAKAGWQTNQFVELKDGRTIAVVNVRMSGDGWVGTHEDITERRRRSNGGACKTEHVHRRSVAFRARRRHQAAGTRGCRVILPSLSDYVQHAYGPGEPEADTFNRAIDDRVQRFIERGAVVGLVADHGMHYKPDICFSKMT